MKMLGNLSYDRILTNSSVFLHSFGLNVHHQLSLVTVYRLTNSHLSGIPDEYQMNALGTLYTQPLALACLPPNSSPW